MLATYPTATPADEQPINAIVGLKPKLPLIGDVRTTPRRPPAMQANKRVCTVLPPYGLLGGLGRKTLIFHLLMMSEVT
jgi:hypothetical protein